MNCRRARGLLMAYLDSELDSSATLEVNRHLEECTACRTRFAAEQKIEAAVAARLRRPEANEEQVVARILQAVLHARRKVSRRTVLAAAGLAAVVLALVVLASLPKRLPEAVRAAAADHQKFVAGTMRPDVVTASAAETAAYLQERVGLSVGELPATDGWRILGPRRCHFGDVSVAYVMLEWEGTPVSLFVMSAEDARPLGVDASPEPRSFELPVGNAALVTSPDRVCCAVGAIKPARLAELIEGVQ